MFRKSILFALLSLSAPSAFAVESQLIATYEHDSDVSMNRFEYDVNLELNRAWVVLLLDDRSNYETGGLSEERKAVRGMYFEPATREVRFNNGRGTTICAVRKTGRRLGLFPYVKYEETGRCDIQVRQVVRRVDNGFEIREKTYDQYFFVVR
jgi:hypothetical protein